MDPLSIVGEVRKQLAALDPTLALFHTRSMEQVIADNTQDTQFQTLLLGSFATLALLLAAVGLYGVMSYFVAQRTREIGIRMALGAERGDVLRLVLREGAELTIAGLICGVLLALVLTRSISSFLFGISPLNPATFIGMAIIMVCVSLLAHLLPACRAILVDPATALRSE